MFEGKLVLVSLLIMKNFDFINKKGIHRNGKREKRSENVRRRTKIAIDTVLDCFRKRDYG